jgi:hypothetical protein
MQAFFGGVFAEVEVGILWPEAETTIAAEQS